MTSKIFSVATFILVAWLTATVVTTSQHQLALEGQLSHQIDSNYRALTARIDAIEAAQQSEIKAAVAEFKKSPPAPPVVKEHNDPALITQMQAEARLLRSVIALQHEPLELRAAYQRVLETEFEKQSDAIGAAEKLLGTKSAIWKASTTHEAIKEELQGLMAPIDILAAQWKNGNTNGSVAPVYSVLKQSLATLNTL